MQKLHLSELVRSFQRCYLDTLRTSHQRPVHAHVRPSMVALVKWTLIDSQTSHMAASHGFTADNGKRLPILREPFGQGGSESTD